MQNSKSEIFLFAKDSLGTLINQKANELFFALKNFDIGLLDITDTYNDYFINHHLGKRLFFSIQNSAHILYETVQLSKKPMNEINAIDYGAGLGTLFMLGGMLGFKQFDYNDHLPEWQPTAASVCKEIGINISNYVMGDINAVTAFAKANNFKYDVVLSRNVIEHIYNLPEFYKVLYHHNPSVVVYATTTANFHNPVMRLYHLYVHKKVEIKYYIQQRKDAILNIAPTLSGADLNNLIKLTRGKGQEDFTLAVNNYLRGIAIEKVPYLRSNSCDCHIGVWCEHLLTKDEYAQIITQANFKMIYSSGYWDTHYSSKAMNVLATFFNKFILLLGKKKGMMVSPFVNVIAYN